MSLRNGKQWALTAKSQFVLVALVVTTLMAQPVGVAKGNNTIRPQSGSTPVVGRLDFLKMQDSTRAYAIDSPFSIPNLTPPYEPGLGQLVVLGGVKSTLFVERTVLAEGSFVGALEMSPDGDTAALLGRGLAGNRIVIVRGLKSGAISQRAVQLLAPPFSLTWSPDGTYLVVGLELMGDEGPQSVKMSLISGLPDAPRLEYTFDLGLSVMPPGYTDIAYLEISRDGGRLLVQAHQHLGNVLPVEGLPIVTLLVLANVRPGAAPFISGKLVLPADNPALPPAPALAGMPTGVANGDSALLCDGDSAIVPVPGAFGPLNSPDARIFLIRGVSTGKLTIVRTLGPADGVPPANYQVALATDCDRAVITRNFRGNALAVVTGLSDPSFASVSVRALPSSYNYGPAEASITADNQTIVAAHPRFPASIYPAAATNYEFGPSFTPLGPPLVGPVRGPFTIRDGLIHTFPPGLSDYLMVFTEGGPPGIRESLLAQINRAVRSADEGEDGTARAALSSFSNQVRVLQAAGILSAVKAGVLTALAHVAIDRLDPGFDLCLQDDDSGDVLRFNSSRGDYLFVSRRAEGFTLAGTGAVSRTGCLIELRDPFVLAILEQCPIAPRNRGRATIYRTPLGPAVLIEDSNTTNNSCAGR